MFLKKSDDQPKRVDYDEIDGSRFYITTSAANNPSTKGICE